MKQKTCTFAGQCQPIHSSRSRRQQQCRTRLKDQLRTEIQALITQHSTTHFVCGMEPGTDLDAAEIVLELKTQYPAITLEAVIPYEEQASLWSERDRNRYYSILEQCDQETLLQKQQTADCKARGIRYQVDACDILLAVWNGTTDRTGETIRYAAKQGKHIIQIDPLV